MFGSVVFMNKMYSNFDYLTTYKQASKITQYNKLTGHHFKIEPT